MDDDPPIHLPSVQPLFTYPPSNHPPTHPASIFPSSIHHHPAIMPSSHSPCIHPSIHLSTYLSTPLSNRPSVHPSTTHTPIHRPSIHSFEDSSIYLSFPQWSKVSCKGVTMNTTPSTVAGALWNTSSKELCAKTHLLTYISF